MASEPGSAAKERLPIVAAQLFSARGHAAVTLRDIATAIGVRQATLYHHVPGGKEQLFVEVTERGWDRARTAIELAIAGTGPEPHPRMRAAARALLRVPPIDIPRMYRSDMPSISPERAAYLTRRAFESLVLPLAGIFPAAHAR